MISGMKATLCCVFLFLIGACTLSFLYVKENETSPLPGFVYKALLKQTKQPVNNESISTSIIDIAKFLKKAKLHARGIKSENALNDAINGLDDLLRNFGTSFNEVTQREIFQSKSMCPEYYVNTTYGFPLFQVGYEIEDCNFQVPLHKLVTVVIVFDGSNTSTLENIISGINKYATGINVIVGIMDTLKNIKAHDNFQISTFPPNSSKGKMLNKLIGGVKTEYTLIARDIMIFDSDVRIERLIREIERLNTVVVGGSIRRSNGDWSLSCYQRAFRNFTVVYQEGYDESMHDCVFCDHTDSPFLIKTYKLLSLKFDESISPMGLYEDFFMRLEEEIAVCPDSMFYVNSPNPSSQIKDWEKFGKKRNLYKLKFSSGLTLNFGCNYAYPCDKKKGYIRSPCCMQELADMNNFIMKVCEESNIICEFHCGTHLGTVKMNKVIPWEIDGDIRVWHGNFSALEKMAPKFSGKYRFQKLQNQMNSCKNGKMTKPGIYYVKSKHWFVELYTFCSLDTYTLKSKHMAPTKAIHNGNSVNMARNPSLAARNRYPQFYSHVQHFREGGVYNVHVFSACKTKGRHDCIDNYRTDGNIQFNDPIP